MYFDLILLALLVVFILLRLRNVLGTTDTMDDLQNRFRDDRFTPKDTGPVSKDFPGSVNESESQNQQGQNQQGGAPIGNPNHVLREISGPATAADQQFSPAITAAISDIAARDRHFNPHQFLDGASSAYPMILTAFWSGDKKTLQTFLSDKVYNSFAGVIDGREKAQMTVGNQFLDLQSADIVDAKLKGSTAVICTKFVAEIIAVTMDKEKNIVEGDASDSVTVSDIWTFERDVDSSDPNWTLTGTRTE